MLRDPRQVVTRPYDTVTRHNETVIGPNDTCYKTQCQWVLKITHWHSVTGFKTQWHCLQDPMTLITRPNDTGYKTQSDQPEVLQTQMTLVTSATNLWLQGPMTPVTTLIVTAYTTKWDWLHVPMKPFIMTLLIRSNEPIRETVSVEQHPRNLELEIS